MLAQVDVRLLDLLRSWLIYCKIFYQTIQQLIYVCMFAAISKYQPFHCLRNALWGQDCIATADLQAVGTKCYVSFVHLQL